MYEERGLAKKIILFIPPSDGARKKCKNVFSTDVVNVLPAREISVPISDMQFHSRKSPLSSRYLFFLSYKSEGNWSSWWLIRWPWRCCKIKTRRRLRCYFNEMVTMTTFHRSQVWSLSCLVAYLLTYVFAHQSWSLTEISIACWMYLLQLVVWYVDLSKSLCVSLALLSHSQPKYLQAATYIPPNFMYL